VSSGKVQAQNAILRKDAVSLMVRWLDAGPEQEVATAAARALAKAAKGNKAVQQAICKAGAFPCLSHLATVVIPYHQHAQLGDNSHMLHEFAGDGTVVGQCVFQMN
jgi:hypothetical protein